MNFLLYHNFNTKRKETKMKNSNSINPFSETHNQEERKEAGMIKPFHLLKDTEEQMIKPFEVDYAFAASKKKSDIISPVRIGNEYETQESTLLKNEERSEKFAEEDYPLIKPFERVSNETADMAAKYAKIFLDDCRMAKSFEPYLAYGIYQFQKDQEIFPLGNLKEDLQMGFLLNFSIKLIKKVSYIQDTSKGEKIFLNYNVQVDVCLKTGERKCFETTVASNKIKNPEWLSKATQSLATSISNKDKKEAFLDLVQDCIETPNVPEEIVYPTAGWRNVPNRGWRYVYHSGMIGEQDSSVHTGGEKYTLDLQTERIGTSDTFYQALKMINVCEDKRASTSLFIITHSAVLTKLFKMATFPISFVYILEAPTNSRKTSLALALSQVFDRENLMADAEFATATNCGIEKTLSLYPDAPVHIDDFKPGVSKADQKILDKKLDEVARFGGNGVPKMRMTDFMPDGDSKYFPIGGVTIVTAELISAVSSSESRMFITEFGTDTVLNERLQYFQSERWILPCHLYDFLAWVTSNFGSIVDFIKTRFPELRREFTFEFGRYAEMYATFLVTAEIIVNYAISMRFWDEKAGAAFIHNIKKIILGDLHLMEEKVRLRDKGKLIIDALLFAVDCRKICPIELTKESCTQRAAAYEDEKFIYIQTRELRRLVSEYVNTYKDNRDIVNDDELCSELEKKKLLDILIKKDGSRERARKLPLQRGNTLRYLYIKKSALKEKCQ